MPDATRPDPPPDSILAKSATRRRPTLAQSVVIVMVMLVVQRLIGFGRGVVFCRWLPPEEYGQWGLAFNFLLLAAPVAVLGLPGSFGRYLEHYQQRGQLRTFLRRTTLATLLLAASTLVLIGFWPQQMAGVIFGDPDLSLLIPLLVVCLAAVILHHFLESLFMALRMTHVVSGMQFVQSVGFAALGVVLLWNWQMDVSSVLVAYGAASFVSACGALFWMRGLIEQDFATEPVAQRAFWGKLLPFTVWMWATNLLANLFAVADRYMIVHFGDLPASSALAAVGNYQSSLIVPLLFTSVADLLAATILPHMSHHWEAGRRAEAVRILNQALKLAALLFLAAGASFLFLAPWLYETLLGGKYDAGLTVLPWSLSFCVLFAMATVAANYLWCAERAHLVSLALGGGLAGNVALNVLLIPRLGIMGAAWGTTAANVLALGSTLLFCRMAGMRIDLGTWLLLAAIPSLGLGAAPAGAVLVIAAVLTIATPWIFGAEEKQQLTRELRRQGSRFAPVVTQQSVS